MHESLAKARLDETSRALFLARLSDGKKVSTSARNAWLGEINAIRGKQATFGDYLGCGSSEYLYLHATLEQAEHAQQMGAFDAIFAVPDKLKMSHELADVESWKSGAVVDLRVLLAEGALRSVDEAAKIAKEWADTLKLKAAATPDMIIIESVPTSGMGAIRRGRVGAGYPLDRAQI